jgi:putative methyltransferase (TIGR04325 family)
MATVAKGFQRLASTARHVPMLGGAIADAYRRYFNGARGEDVRLFRGVFPSFETAALSVPSGHPLGYDNPASATRMLGEWLAVHPSDYPVMFWLAKLLPGSKTVFDWGGSVGLKYFAFRRYLEYANDLEWLVSEVPAVVEVGREIARDQRATALRFTTDFTGMANADVLLASGVLQFIDDPFSGLRAQPRLPRHLIVNKAPVYQLQSAVTLHNMGTAFCPYHLFNRRELVRAIETLGYRLVDEWRLPGVNCEIPFHPEHSIGAYTGFYFASRDR